MEVGEGINKAKFRLTFWDGREEDVTLFDSCHVACSEDIMMTSKIISNHMEDDRELVKKIRIMENNEYSIISFLKFYVVKVIEFDDRVSLKNLYTDRMDQERNNTTIINLPDDISNIECRVYDHIDGLDRLLEHNPNLDINIKDL